MRLACRSSPEKSVERNAATIPLAASAPMMRPPSASRFASLWARVSLAVVSSPQSAQRADLVGADGYAHARAADQNAALIFSARDRLRHGESDVGIIHARFIRAAEIRGLVPEGCEIGQQLFFQGIAAVVAAYGDFHDVLLNRSCGSPPRAAAGSCTRGPCPPRAAPRRTRRPPRPNTRGAARTGSRTASRARPCRLL